MDNYIVSARKYRPSTFRSVVGQKSLTTTLKNAIQSNKLAHAYLFCSVLTISMNWMPPRITRWTISVP